MWEPELRAFYDFHSCLMEPWDGPAALALTDGRYAIAALDRNACGLSATGSPAVAW